LNVNRIEVVSRHAGGSSGSGGFGRTPAFETETVRVGETHVRPSSSSPWHHHGRRTLYAFVVSGEILLEFGPRGREKVRATAGDFFRIPAGLVHRDVNPTAQEAMIVNTMIGEGRPIINVDGPDE
jgi:quercetin dioxygenase-like cupin family protein